MILEWDSAATYAAKVRPGLVVGVVSNFGAKEYAAFAFETEPDNEELEAILNNHAHQVIGIYSSLEDAMIAATEWAGAHMKVENAKCQCSSIDKEESSVPTRTD